MAGEQTVLLAVFDILGFSRRVQNSSLSEVQKIYNLLREKTVKRNDLTSFNLLPWTNDPNDPDNKVRVPAVLRLEVKSVVFSDSVFAWVPMKRGFANLFIKWCCNFVCEGLAMEVPIRGAIAAGNAILDLSTNTFIGKPIIEAHELEANQDWIGLAFSHHATLPPLIADIDPKLLMEYPIPVKKGKTTCISPDWPRVWRDDYGECPSKKLRSLVEANPKT